MKKHLKPETDPRPPLKKGRASLILGIISAVFIALTVLGIWFMREFLTDTEAVRAWIGERYLLGAVCLILISAVQVILALIPGEFVEIAAGYVFGAWGGAFLCLFGILLGSCLTILLVRRFGRRFVYTFYPKEKIDALPILNDPKKRNFLLFILFLIPGTPKDLLTYAVGLTDMSIPLYLMLTSAARFPSIIISSMGGNAVGEQKFVKALIVLLISALVSLIGIFVYKRITKTHEAHKEKKAGSAACPSETADDCGRDCDQDRETSAEKDALPCKNGGESGNPEQGESAVRDHPPTKGADDEHEVSSE